MFNETSRSFFVWGIRERLLPCCVVTAMWVVSCTRITCIQPLSRYSLTLLASSFFSESVVVVFSLSSPSFSPCVLSFLSLVYWPFRIRLLACLIMAAILQFSCRLHLFTSRCFVIGSPDQCFALSVCSLIFFQMEAGLVKGQFRVRYGKFVFPSVCRWHSYFCSMLL